jgi:transcriptional regulator with XRE-family HTH domain
VRDPEALRRWRQRRGLSQRDLAYLCRCSQATISLIERGTMATLSDELALGLSARLQVPWEDLFDPADHPSDADVQSARRASTDSAS